MKKLFAVLIIALFVVSCGKNPVASETEPASKANADQEYVGVGCINGMSHN